MKQPKRLTLDVFSTASNAAIVQMSSRHFPGLVLQGDSLSVLYRLSTSIAERAKLSADSELIDETEELRLLLEAYIQQYEAVLEAHGLALPYSRST